MIVRVQKGSRRECKASSLRFQTVELQSEYPLLHASSESRDDFGTQLSYLGEDRSKEDEQKCGIGLEAVSSRGVPPAALRIQPPRP